MECPLGKDKVHCQNCYWLAIDGQCDYDRVMRKVADARERISREKHR